MNQHRLFFNENDCLTIWLYIYNDPMSALGFIFIDVIFIDENDLPDKMFNEDNGRKVGPSYHLKGPIEGTGSFGFGREISSQR